MELGSAVPWGCAAAFPGLPRSPPGGSLVLLALLPPEGLRCRGSSRGRETSPGVGGRSDGNWNAWLQITNVFCCGTLIKLLFQLVHCGAVNGAGPARPSSPPLLVIQMQISFVLIPHNCSASRLGLPEAPRKSCLLRLQFRLYIICDNYSYKV